MEKRREFRPCSPITAAQYYWLNLQAENIHFRHSQRDWSTVDIAVLFLP